MRVHNIITDNARHPPPDHDTTRYPGRPRRIRVVYWIFRSSNVDYDSKTDAGFSGPFPFPSLPPGIRDTLPTTYASRSPRADRTAIATISISPLLRVAIVSPRPAVVPNRPRGVSRFDHQLPSPEMLALPVLMGVLSLSASSKVSVRAIAHCLRHDRLNMPGRRRYDVRRVPHPCEPLRGTVTSGPLVLFGTRFQSCVRPVVLR
jgi:hypothetical protein